jgi:Fic family protein
VNASSRFQPLSPDERALGPLVEQAATLVAEGHRLESAAGTLARALKPLLRSMNSYYTNKIEGQHTRPADIERALKKQFDADAKQAQKQRLAVAHVETEEELENELPSNRASLFAPGYVREIHKKLYGKLPRKDRVIDQGRAITPGELRTTLVAAGNHLAPPPSDIDELLGAWQAYYSAVPGVELAIVAGACSHHRLLWIHPFPDGNGRAARLHSHLLFTALRLTHGLWSPLRGMARDREGYYARLNNADLPRRNDLDGRGPLSQEGLVAFAEWFIAVCIDQARFMRDVLGLEQMKVRLSELLLFLSAHPWKVGSEMSVVKTEALEALHYTAFAGPVDRSRFMAMTGLPARTARRVLSSLLHFGLLASSGSRAKVAFHVPLRGLRFLFPRLWPEAEIPD